MSDAEPATRLRELLSPVLAKVAALEPARRESPDQIAELERALEEAFPFEGKHGMARSVASPLSVDQPLKNGPSLSAGRYMAKGMVSCPKGVILESLTQSQPGSPLCSNLV